MLVSAAPDPPFWAAVGATWIKTLAGQIGAFCVLTSRCRERGRPVSWHPGIAPAGRSLIRF